MSMIVEGSCSLIGDDSLDSSDPHLPAVSYVEIGAEPDQLANIIGNDVFLSQSRNVQSVDVDSADVLPLADVLLSTDDEFFADVVSSANFLPSADAPPSVEFMLTETRGSALEDSKVLIKEDEDFDSDRNVFRAVIDSCFGIVTDDHGDFGWTGLFKTESIYDKARMVPENGFYSKVCKSWLNSGLQPTNSRLLQNTVTYNISSHIKIRDVRVLLVDIFPRKSRNSSSNVSVNHTNSKSCKCISCAAKFRYRVKVGNVLNKGKMRKADELKIKSEEKCRKFEVGQWYTCGVCPARFIFAHNLVRHSMMHHNLRLCSVCQQKFDSDLDLQTHMKIHPSKERHSCLFCDFQSLTEVELEVHLKTHAGIKAYSCAKCDIEFEGGYDLLEHISEHNYERPRACEDSALKPKIKSEKYLLNDRKTKLWSCTYCPAKFRFGCRLRDHMISHTGEKRYACPYCRAKFITEPSLNLHLVRHSSDAPLACSFCPATFKLPSLLKEHEMIHKSERSFACKFCPAKFTDRSHMRVHVKIHRDEKTYSCKLCDSKCQTATALKDHLRIHNDVKLFLCSYCPRKFTKEKNLNVHERMHVNDVKHSLYSACSSKSTNKSRLMVHVMDQTGKPLYVCDHCDNTFKTKGMLKKHVVVHFQRKLFTCDQCSAVYKSAGGVRQHQSSHSTERPFACDLCPSTFKIKYRLSRHMKIHTRKAFACEHCELKFQTKKEILRHLSVHAVKRPHLCRFCSAQFKHKSQLKEHVVREHSAKKAILYQFCPTKVEGVFQIKKHRMCHSEERLSDGTRSEQIKKEIREEIV